jgi:hypothetical protein
MGTTIRGCDVEASELQTILQKHAEWLRNEGGKRADLTRANLTGADLTRAYLTGAYLTWANLTGADLTGAYLTNTCLSPELGKLQRALALACPPVGRHGGRIVYRTYKSQHVCTTTYEPGHTYVAPILSFSVETACHPGIYAGSMKWIDEEYPNMPLVRCYVRDGDWIITAKGAIRCKRLRVLGMVDDGGRR